MAPIRADMRKRYPKDWKARSRFVRHYRARNCCEWCSAANGEPHPVTGSLVVLTVAHVHDKNPEAAHLLNLAALCQRCHNRHDADDRQAARRARRLAGQGRLPLACPERTRRTWPEAVHRPPVIRADGVTALACDPRRPANGHVITPYRRAVTCRECRRTLRPRAFTLPLPTGELPRALAMALSVSLELEGTR